MEKEEKPLPSPVETPPSGGESLPEKAPETPAPEAPSAAVTTPAPEKEGTPPEEVPKNAETPETPAPEKLPEKDPRDLALERAKDFLARKDEAILALQAQLASAQAVNHQEKEIIKDLVDADSTLKVRLAALQKQGPEKAEAAKAFEEILIVFDALLFNHEVETSETDLTKGPVLFDYKTMAKIGDEITSDPLQAKQVYRSLSPAYSWRGTLVQKEKVLVYFYKQNSEK